MTKVYAPNKAYGGTVGGVKFEAGVADVADSSPEMSYFRKKGYGIGTAADPEASLSRDKLEPTLAGVPIDARDYATSTPVGSHLRDAAVDPKPGDFLPPTNAGEANPHGPSVVAPGIHGVGPGPIRPGRVFVDDTDRQAAEETALAQDVLVDGSPAADVSTPADADRGPLGLSDPGSVQMGIDAALVAPEPATLGLTPVTAAPAKPVRKPTTRKSTTKSTSKASRPRGTTK